MQESRMWYGDGGHIEKPGSRRAREAHGNLGTRMASASKPLGSVGKPIGRPRRLRKVLERSWAPLECHREMPLEGHGTALEAFGMCRGHPWISVQSPGTPLETMGISVETHGASLDARRRPWGALGRPCGRSWMVLGRPWTLLEGPGTPLEPIVRHGPWLRFDTVGRTWQPLQRLGRPLEAIGSSGTRLEGLLGLSARPWNPLEGHGTPLEPIVR